MSFLQKLEDLLRETGSGIMAEEQVLVAWIHRLVHHHRAGDTIAPPPQAGVGDGATRIGNGTAATPIVTPAPAPEPTPAPVVTPPPVVAAPAPEPVPAAAPAPAPLGKGKTGDWRNGVQLQPDGSVRSQVFEDAWAATEPKLCPHYFGLDDVPDLFDMDEQQLRNHHGSAAVALLGNTSEWPQRKVDASYLSNAYVYTADGPGGTLRQGAQIMDAMAFPQRNVVEGAVVFPGVKTTDLMQVVANCNAQRTFALAHQEDPIQVEGTIPVIDHSHSGAVAG